MLSFLCRLGCGALLLLPSLGLGQVLDPSFQRADFRTPAVSGLPAAVQCLAPDGQGRVVIGGSFSFIGGQAVGNIARLLPGGQLDPSFNPGGTGTNDQVTELVPLSGGRWLIAGNFTRYNGQPAPRLARLHPDGTLDTTFRVGTGPDVVRRLAVDAQERIVLAGGYPWAGSRRYNGRRVGLLYRVLPSGALDSTFRPANGVGSDSLITALAVDFADRIVVSHYHYNQTHRNLERLLPSGALDPTFNAGTPGIVGGLVERVKPLRTGQILLMANGASYDGHPLLGLIRLNSDGIPDSTFRPTVGASQPTIIVETPAGVLFGSNHLGAPGQPTNLVRLRADGSVDPTFIGPSLTTALPVGWLTDVRVGAGAKLLIGGYFSTVAGHGTTNVARLLPNGDVDGSFAAEDAQIRAGVGQLIGLTNDRLLVVGDFTTAYGTYSPNIARLLADGTYDPTLQPDARLSQSVYYGVAVDSSGRLLTIWYDTLTRRQRLLRFQPNGQLDLSYRQGIGATGAASAQLSGVAAYPDGRALVGGGFTAYNGQPRPGLVRLLADGTVDPAFQPSVSPAGPLGGQPVLLADGSIALLAGGGGPIPGPPLPTFLQWLDATGQPLPGINGGQPIVIDPLGALMIALPDTALLLSVVDTVNGVPGNRTRKLTRAGTFDPAFVLDATLEGTVTGVLPQPDGRLLLFRAYHVPRVVRVTATGALDATLRWPAFETGGAATAVFQSTGKLVVGGNFTTVDGVLRPSLVRLTDVVTGRPTPAAAPAVLAAFPNPAHNSLTLRRPTAEPATATLLDVLGRPVRRWPLTAAETRLPLTGVTAGTYVVRVVSAAGVATRRVVVE